MKWTLCQGPVHTLWQTHFCLEGIPYIKRSSESISVAVNKLVKSGE